MISKRAHIPPRIANLFSSIEISGVKCPTRPLGFATRDARLFRGAEGIATEEVDTKRAEQKGWESKDIPYHPRKLARSSDSCVVCAILLLASLPVICAAVKVHSLASVPLSLHLQRKHQTNHLEASFLSHEPIYSDLEESAHHTLNWDHTNLGSSKTKT